MPLLSRGTNATCSRPHQTMTMWKILFQLVNYVRPQAARDMLKWAAWCQRCQETERQTFPRLSLCKRRWLVRCRGASGPLDAGKTVDLNQSLHVTNMLITCIIVFSFFVKSCSWEKLIINQKIYWKCCIVPGPWLNKLLLHVLSTQFITAVFLLQCFLSSIHSMFWGKLV